MPNLIRNAIYSALKPGIEIKHDGDVKALIRKICDNTSGVASGVLEGDILNLIVSCTLSGYNIGGRIGGKPGEIPFEMVPGSVKVEGNNIEYTMRHEVRFACLGTDVEE